MTTTADLIERHFSNELRRLEIPSQRTDSGKPGKGLLWFSCKTPNGAKFYGEIHSDKEAVTRTLEGLKVFDCWRKPSPENLLSWGTGSVPVPESTPKKDCGVCTLYVPDQAPTLFDPKTFLDRAKRLADRAAVLVDEVKTHDPTQAHQAEQHLADCFDLVRQLKDDGYLPTEDLEAYPEWAKSKFRSDLSRRISAMKLELGKAHWLFKSMVVQQEHDKASACAERVADLEKNLVEACAQRRTEILRAVSTKNQRDARFNP